MMIRTKLNLKRTFFLLLAFGYLATFGQKKAELIDQVMNAYADYGLFSGSILVSENGKVIYKNGLGLANAEWDISNSPQTKFRIGSLTKQFTSMLVMQLVEEGQLELNTPISEYLADYPRSSGDKITIHHLLTHTSGIPNFTSFPQYRREYMRKPFSSEMLVKTFADSTLDFNPGERYNYSNSGYVLLGHILQTVAQQSYEDLLQERIFEPLGMNNSGYDRFQSVLPKRATGYFNSFIQPRNAAFIDMSVPYAAGAIYSTVEDLFLWDKALRSNTILSQKYLRETFTPRVSAGRFNYGYGWAVGETPVGPSGDSTRVVLHSGAINGFTALITRFPEDEHCIIITGNMAYIPIDEIAQTITSILYGQSYLLPRKPFTQEIVQRIEKQGPKRVFKSFEQLTSASELAPINEFEMNQLGYEYLRSGKLEEALSVFKINVQAFPNSSNVYDSYAEALRIKGDIKASIKNYKKSIELDPGNQNGLRMLSQMGVQIETTSFDTAMLQVFVGTYQVMPSFKITITKEGDQLFGQATGQPKLELVQKAENKFHSPIANAEILFNKDPEDGAVKSLTLTMGETTQVAPRIE